MNCTKLARWRLLLITTKELNPKSKLSTHWSWYFRLQRWVWTLVNTRAGSDHLLGPFNYELTARVKRKQRELVAAVAFSAKHSGTGATEDVTEETNVCIQSCAIWNETVRAHYNFMTFIPSIPDRFLSITGSLCASKLVSTPSPAEVRLTKRLKYENVGRGVYFGPWLGFLWSRVRHFAEALRTTTQGTSWWTLFQENKEGSTYRSFFHSRPPPFVFALFLLPPSQCQHPSSSQDNSPRSNQTYVLRCSQAERL